MSSYESLHPYVVPALRSWYDSLNQSQKEQYRKAFNATEATTTSESSQTILSFHIGFAPLPQFEGTELFIQDVSNTTKAPQSPSLRDTIALPLDNKHTEVEEAQNTVSSLLDKSSSKPENLPSALTKASLPPATFKTRQTINNKVEETTLAYDERLANSQIQQAQMTANKARMNLGNDMSVYSGRRVPSYGTKVPLSLRRGHMSILENSLLKTPTLTTELRNSDSLPLRSVPDGFALPNWYKELHITQHSTYSQRELQQLLQIRHRIEKCSVHGTTKEFLNAQYNLIRVDLHKYDHMLVDEVLIKKSRLLEYGVGLPQLFSTSERLVVFPYDIAADAESLYNKWRRHDFDPDILRGIDYRKKKGNIEKSRLSSTLIHDYPNRISANEFGENDLVNGQWWPILLAAMRDGAHGATQAGIHGVAGKGAYSILVSGAQYDDKDEGDVLYYCGTVGGDDGESTDATKRLHENIATCRPVRVLRTSKLPTGNPYRPSFGFRYDGLYDVLDFEVLNPRKGHHRFRLKRQENQGPIRCKGIYARPSPDDIEAYKRIAGME